MTQDEVKRLFDYRDGTLYWRDPPATHRHKTGQAAGAYNSIHNRIKIQCKRRIYGAHQLIFLMFHGYIPKCIDHIDRNPMNNRIENLREVTFSGNAQNAGIRKDNTTGLKNVSWHKHRKKWTVQLAVNSKIRHFGYYDDIELAELVAEEARSKYHGKFAYVGMR